MNWRRSEWMALASPIITIALWIWFASAKAAIWDIASNKIQEMGPKVEDHGKQLAVLLDAVGDIRDDVRYLRRHSNP